MIPPAAFDQRPVIVAIAGPNGAGKTTFYHSHIAPAGLRLINADVLAAELDLPADEAMVLANALRRGLLEQRESFAFETVFSDPVGDKIGFLSGAVAAGYQVILCFIGLASPEQSEERVAMRVSQGGHDVPADKLHARFPRTLANLRNAIGRLPHIMVFDNSDLERPYRLVATYEHGHRETHVEPLPQWLIPAV